MPYENIGVSLSTVDTQRFLVAIGTNFIVQNELKSLKKIKITKLNKMKRRFFYYFSIIPRNFIIFNFVFNSTKINDSFRKLADANCRAPDRTDNARWGCTKIIKLSFIFLSPLVYRSYHCYYIYSNN